MMKGASGIFPAISILQKIVWFSREGEKSQDKNKNMPEKKIKKNLITILKKERMFKILKTDISTRLCLLESKVYAM